MFQAKQSEAERLILENQIKIMQGVYRCLEGLGTEGGLTWPLERKELREQWGITKEFLRKEARRKQ